MTHYVVLSFFPQITFHSQCFPVSACLFFTNYLRITFIFTPDDDQSGMMGYSVSLIKRSLQVLPFTYCGLVHVSHFLTIFSR